MITDTLVMISFLLLINNGTQKLFDSAIIESGPVGYSLPSFYEFQEIFDNVVDEVGCKNSSAVIQCLKEAPPNQFLENKYFRYNPYPVIDGVLITEQPADAIKNGKISRVPIIIGTNTNEVFISNYHFREHSSQKEM
jgi:acetylcholinesterase